MKFLTRALVQIPLIILIAILGAPKTVEASFKIPQYRSQSVEVIDIHQHVGDAGSMGPLGKQFVLSNLPKWLPMGFKNWSLETYANLVLRPALIQLARVPNTGVNGCNTRFA
ncbi:hypothetical protein EBR21_13805 [bacterium]|nr:hypothetical protein [bacterium]